MIKSMLALAILCSQPAWGQSQWFAMLGDANDPAVDTVEVDPATFNRQGATRSLHIRVSRALRRTSWDGTPYRSYTADVSIDCTQSKGRYLLIEFFALPGWQGQPYGKTAYLPGEVRPMLFLDMTPNPTQQIIRAACQTNNVQNITR